MSYHRTSANGFDYFTVPGSVTITPAYANGSDDCPADDYL